MNVQDSPHLSFPIPSAVCCNCCSPHFLFSSFLSIPFLPSILTISLPTPLNPGMSPMDGSAFEKIAENYRLGTFQVDNPYILIPQSSSCVSVTLTVSQVTVWPRAVALGQSSQIIKRYLFHHRVAAWHQWYESSLFFIFDQLMDRNITYNISHLSSFLPSFISAPFPLTVLLYFSLSFLYVFPSFLPSFSLSFLILTFPASPHLHYSSCRQAFTQ